jgi:hypothetical protein
VIVRGGSVAEIEPVVFRAGGRQTQLETELVLGQGCERKRVSHITAFTPQLTGQGHSTLRSNDFIHRLGRATNFLVVFQGESTPVLDDGCLRHGGGHEVGSRNRLPEYLFRV